MFDYPLSPKAKKCGDGWIDTCPAHQDNNPSLSITYRDGKLLLKCFAGCSFDEIIRCVGVNERYGRTIPLYETNAIKNTFDNELLYYILDRTSPITKSSPVAKYLQSRGLDNYHNIPDICYHSDMYYAHKETLPCMVGIIRLRNKIIGLHRTFLTSDGQKVAKKMLGKVSLGIVKLVDNNRENLFIAEGIENALSYMKLHINHVHDKSIWVGLSATNLPSIHLPNGVGNLTVIADNDPTGLEASEKLLKRASKLGWRTFEVVPKCRDWNDELMKRIYNNG